MRERETLEQECTFKDPVDLAGATRGNFEDARKDGELERRKKRERREALLICSTRGLQSSFSLFPLSSFFEGQHFLPISFYNRKDPNKNERKTGEGRAKQNEHEVKQE